MLGDIYTGMINFNGTSLFSPSCPTEDYKLNSTSVVPDAVTLYASLGVFGKCQDSTCSLRKSCGTWSAPSYATASMELVIDGTKKKEILSSLQLQKGRYRSSPSHFSRQAITRLSRDRQAGAIVAHPHVAGKILVRVLGQAFFFALFLF